MIKIELDQPGSDDCGQRSLTTSPRGADNRSSRDRSRSKDGFKFWDTWSRGGMDVSISPGKDFGAEKYRKGGKHTRLPMKHELEEGEIHMERKRARYSDHRSKAHSKDSLEKRYCSHEISPPRHGTNSHREEKHELPSFSRDVPTCGDKATSEDAPHLSKWRSGTANHACDKDDDINLPGAGPKWGGEGNSKDAPRSCRSSATKWDTWETRNTSSWNGPKRDDRADTKDATASSQRRLDDDKWDSKLNTNSCSAWNGPKWSDETKTDVAANLSQWKSVDDDPGSNVDANKSLSHTCLKWGDKTDSKAAPRLCGSSGAKWVSKQTDCNSSWNGGTKGVGATINDVPASSQWRSDADDWGSKAKISNSSSWNVPKLGDEITDEIAPHWGDSTNAKDAPRRSSNTNWDPWETNNSTRNGPNWNDRASTRDAPGSLHGRSDVDKWESDVKTDNRSSWAGSKWDDTTNAKDASCLMKSSNTDWDPWETKNSSRNGPNRDDRATTKDALCSLQWRSDVDKRGSNVKSDNRSSWTGPKSCDKANAMDAPCSKRLSNTDWDPWEAKNNSSRNGPNHDDRAITKDAPSSLQWRSDVDKWGSNVKTGNRSSGTGSKWGAKTNANDASRSRRSSDTDRDPWETNCSSSRNAPNRDYRATTKDAPGSSQWRSDVGIRGSDVKIDNCSSWADPKWGDKTNVIDATCTRRSSNTDWDPWEAKNNISCKGPKNLEDRAITKDAPGSLQRRSDVDKCWANVKTDNCSTWNGPKWGDQTAAKSMPNSSGCRPDNEKHANIVENRKTSLNGPEWDDHITTKDAPKSPKQWSDGDGRDCGPKLIDSFSWGSTNGDRTPTKDILNFSQHYSDGERKRNGVKDNSRSGEIGAKCADQTSTKCAARFSCSRSDAVRWGSTEMDNMKSVHNSNTSKAEDAKNCCNKETKKGSSWNDNRRGCDLETEKTSLKCANRMNQNSIEDATKPGNVRRDYYNPKHGINFSSDAPELKSQLPAVVSHQKTGKIQEINKEDREGIRMFKFALAEFAKNILKPLWREGNLSKETHKTIVKKVVDKVIGALKGAEIPRTHRNIDLYMDYSRTKLTNLVQAYLEKCATSCAHVDVSDRALDINMGSKGKMSAKSLAA